MLDSENLKIFDDNCLEFKEYGFKVEKWAFKLMPELAWQIQPEMAQSSHHPATCAIASDILNPSFPDHDVWDLPGHCQRDT